MPSNKTQKVFAETAGIIHRHPGILAETLVIPLSLSREEFIPPTVAPLIFGCGGQHDERAFLTTLDGARAWSVDRVDVEALVDYSSVSDVDGEIRHREDPTSRARGNDWVSPWSPKEV